MPQFGRSAILAIGVTSTGVGSSYWSPDAKGGGVVHFDGASFNVQIEGTNFFDPNVEVGSRWTAVGSAQTVGGFQILPPNSPFVAYRADVDAVASGSDVSVAISF